TAAFSAAWEGSAALPTLAFGNYVALDENGRQTGECSDNALLRPEGDRYGPPTPLTPGWCTLSILFSDWDRSGHRDLRMANDRHYYRDGQEQLWRFVEGEPPAPYAAEDGWQSLQIWGMGIASYDVTGDGLPEVFLTSQGDNKLQTLSEDATGPSYEDIAILRGVTAHRPFAGDDILPSTGWHAEFVDVNNDGYVDLYISKGNVDAIPEFAAEDPNNLFLGAADGTFTEGAPAAGIVRFASTRGAALADFNLDGLLDLVEVNRSEPVTLWRNVGSGDAGRPQPMGHWIAIRLLEPGTNRDAIGAWVEVRSGDRMLAAEVTIGGGHAGDKLGWIHFGLGQTKRAEVRVQWPDGETGPWLDVEADGFAVVERGADEARRWRPEQEVSG
ncbi:MAG: CRTAC1 family protein, partial [Acidimicrobiia bacterium]|nr:CRTAC1 family protein [Acidimicrobiia bacterium]